MTAGGTEDHTNEGRIAEVEAHLRQGVTRFAAYYYNFEPTGEESVDRVLAAVATAGKWYHHTESWGDEDRDGRSAAGLIQAAAGIAAAELAAARTERDRIEAGNEYLRANAVAAVRLMEQTRRERDALAAKIEAVETEAKFAQRALADFRLWLGSITYPTVICDVLDTSLARLAALSGVGGNPTPAAEGPWAVDLIDCGRDDGVQVCATWAEADAFRQSYVASAEQMQHCERTAVIHRAVPGTRLGYRDPAPYFDPGPVVGGVSGSPEEPRGFCTCYGRERARDCGIPEHRAEAAAICPGSVGGSETDKEQP
jgi:hypothetical protein